VASNGNEVTGAKVYTTEVLGSGYGDYSNINGKFIPLTSSPSFNITRPVSIRQYKNDPGSASFVATRRTGYNNYTKTSLVQNVSVSFDMEITAESSTNYPGIGIFSLIGYFLPDNTYLITRDIKTKVNDMSVMFLSKGNNQFLLRNTNLISASFNLTPATLLTASVELEGDNLEVDTSGTDDQNTNPISVTKSEYESETTSSNPFILKNIVIEIVNENDPDNITTELICPSEVKFSIKGTKDSVNMLGPVQQRSTLIGVNVEGSFKMLLNDGDYLTFDPIDTDAIHKRSMKITATDTSGANSIYFSFPEFVITDVQDGDGGKSDFSIREYTFVCLPNKFGNIMGVNNAAVFSGVVTHYGTPVTDSGTPVTHTP
jgi:hypothetical protein